MRRAEAGSDEPLRPDAHTVLKFEGVLCRLSPRREDHVYRSLFRGILRDGCEMDCGPAPRASQLALMATRRRRKTNPSATWSTSSSRCSPTSSVVGRMSSVSEVTSRTVPASRGCAGTWPTASASRRSRAGAVRLCTSGLGLSMSAVSHQLAILRHLRLVAAREKGRKSYYRVVDVVVARLVHDCLAHMVGEGPWGAAPPSPSVGEVEARG